MQGEDLRCNGIWQAAKDQPHKPGDQIITGRCMGAQRCTLCMMQQYTRNERMKIMLAALRPSHFAGQYMILQALAATLLLIKL